MRWPRLPRALTARRVRGKHAAAPVRRTPSWAPTATPPAEEHVLLGFADGSEVELGADDPTARELQAMADVLLRQEPA
jgi:hypothetical protein